MKSLLCLLILNLFLCSTTFSQVNKAKVNIDSEFVSEMTKKALDFHAMLDDLPIEKETFKVVKSRKSQMLHEDIYDRYLAPIVVIANRAPKGSANDAQRAKVFIDGVLVKTYKVSTGRTGHPSRTGYFRPTYTNHFRFYNEYYSGKYGSRMAKAIFYSGGYAIHHTDSVQKLGQRASAGCIRFKIEDITWINDKAMKLLGNKNYKMRTWSYGHHPNWKKINHYVGLNRNDIHPINRYTGEIDYSKETKSIDMVIIVKDEMDSDHL